MGGWGGGMGMGGDGGGVVMKYSGTVCHNKEQYVIIRDSMS